jgi:hypothetical protein
MNKIKKKAMILFIYPAHPVHPVNSFLRFKLDFYQQARAVNP